MIDKNPELKSLLIKLDKFNQENRVGDLVRFKKGLVYIYSTISMSPIIFAGQSVVICLDGFSGFYNIDCIKNLNLSEVNNVKKR